VWYPSAVFSTGKGEASSDCAGEPRENEMRERVALRGALARTTVWRGGLDVKAHFLGTLLSCVIASGCSCGPDALRLPAEKMTVSGGEPGVDAKATGIQDRTQAGPGQFTPTSPVQCDSFLQKQTAKVDILWAVDNTGSMGPKQQKVQNDFSVFMQHLTTPDENGNVPDYHLGVVTTDMFNPDQSGKLQNGANLAHPWIGLDTCGGGCDPVAAFKAAVNVGTRGAGEPKGLLAAALALTPPLSTGANAGFLRPDATLIVIFVSDAEDTSCAPVNTSPYALGCTEPLDYGATDYYVRLFEGLKGFGGQNLVKVYSFVGTTQDKTIPDSNSQIQGCLTDNGSQSDPFAYAWYAPRYITVATAVTGASGPQSICSGTFQDIFQALPIVLANTFFLTRAPVAGTTQCTVTKNAMSTRFKPGDPGFSVDATKDAVAFDGTHVPAAGSVVECCYSAH
jgi:hypothetical protein